MDYPKIVFKLTYLFNKYILQQLLFAKDYK